MNNNRLLKDIVFFISPPLHFNEIDTDAKMPADLPVLMDYFIIFLQTLPHYGLTVSKKLLSFVTIIFL
ncbi:MAG TPA: hypothetical protein DEG06_07165 [Lachnospiraceae bacterium]|nr:hypothetical protein [Lachnospiraceae bacterium]HBY72005.1 hypothetical protein [Lachnospiraceae bacterium]HCA69897.1 hypothetical protein [Lachnospiraceae bacterium]